MAEAENKVKMANAESQSWIAKIDNEWSPNDFERWTFKSLEEMISFLKKELAEGGELEGYGFDEFFTDLEEEAEDEGCAGLVPKKGQGNKLAAIVQSSSYVPCSAAAQAAELGKTETAYACAFDEVAKWVQRNPFLADKDDSSLTYVDVLQYAFFSMLHEQLGYNGFYCPEKSRESHAIASKDYKKSKYYFGHEDHTHPCIALFVPDNVSVLAVVPKEQLYIEIGNVIDKDESMMQYSKRSELLSKAVDAWKENSQSRFADRFYDDKHLSIARYYIQHAQDVYRSVDGFLPKEKRTRDQLT